MIIAIDFDGTIVKHKFPDIGPEMPNAFRILKKWQTQGHKLILWTCRNHGELYEGRDLLLEAVLYCESNGLEFDAINCNSGEIAFNPEPKVYADLYIDDRANFSFIDWLKFDYLLEKKKDFGATPQYVISYVQDKTGIKDLRVKRRYRTLVDARRVAMTVLKYTTPMSLNDIGLELGGFDHATVLVAVNVANTLRYSNNEFARRYNPIFEHFNI